MSLRDGPRAPDVHDLDDAIWRTIAYAGLFQYPLRREELRRRLMDVAAGEDEIAARLAAPALRRRLSPGSEFVLPAGREAWVELRRRRAERTETLRARHRRALEGVARFPFVRLVALSGACAHGNATDSDVDVFLIVRASRAWAVTLLLMTASKLAGLRGTLCLNYVLADDRLALPEQDRFTAAEVMGMRPLAGGAAYRRFVRANGWVAAFHPNFFADHERESRGVTDRVGAGVLESALDAAGAGAFERLARRLLEPHLRRRIGGDGVDLSAWRLKLHGRDHRAPVGRAFEAAIA